MSNAIVTTSWDDGHPLDMKLAHLLGKYEIPATFFIPIRNSQRRDVLDGKGILELSEAFDIGGHTYNHVDLTGIDLEEAKEEILKGKETIENIIGRDVESFCYPLGKYNKDIIEIVRQSGFSCARTVRLLETSIKDPFQLGTTAHVTEKGLTHITNYFLKSRDLPNRRMVCRLIGGGAMFRDWYHLANNTLEYVVRKGGVFHLWGHSWEIEQFGQWGKLEVFLARMMELKERGMLKTVSLTESIK
ncbi:MAG: polysaccharide deacetylase family protein [Candidatus Methanofastidiosa archaeon]|nr:polysaccharide deacetylase family protein [Candidatus Methanofastidiosa archaeon]